MKRNIMGLSAIVIALAAAAFTTTPKDNGKFVSYFFPYNLAGTTLLNTTGLPPQANYPDCDGVSINCSQEWTGYAPVPGQPNKYQPAGSLVQTHKKD